MAPRNRIGFGSSNSIWREAGRVGRIMEQVSDRIMEEATEATESPVEVKQASENTTPTPLNEAAAGDGGKRPQKKAGRKPATVDEINEACKVWIAYEREGKGQKEFCDWWNGDKKVGRVTPKWLEAKLALVRKLKRVGRVPAEFTNKLKPLRRVKSIAKKTVKNSHHSR